MPITRLVVLLSLVAACGGGSRDRTAAQPTSTATEGKSSPAPQMPNPNAQVNRQADGQRAEREGRWRDAVSAYQAEVAATPNNSRALNDLAWAQFRTHDYSAAKASAQAALSAAIDPAQKATALYNMGRVAESERDTAKAIELYDQSVALRPNATVSSRRTALSKDDLHPKLSTNCVQPMTEKDLCKCLVAEASVGSNNPSVESGRQTPSCTALSPLGNHGPEIERTSEGWGAGAVDGFGQMSIKSEDLEGSSTTFLLAKINNKWKVVFQLVTGDNYIEQVTLLRVEKDQILGAKRIVQFASTTSAKEFKCDGPCGDPTQKNGFLFCVLDAQASCPLELSVNDFPIDKAPIQQNKVTITVSAAGVVAVQRAAGSPAPTILGDHRLW
jgi:tetratricopeptide (TPR) repeat protein